MRPPGARGEEAPVNEHVCTHRGHTATSPECPSPHMALPPEDGNTGTHNGTASPTPQDRRRLPSCPLEARVPHTPFLR